MNVRCVPWGNSLKDSTDDVEGNFQTTVINTLINQLEELFANTISCGISAKQTGV